MTVITALTAALLTGAGAFVTIGMGKADKADLEEHCELPAHHDQRVVNSQTNASLKRLEEKAEEAVQQNKAAHDRIIQEIRRIPR